MFFKDAGPAGIYVFFGLIASGKSTLARGWAEHRGCACYNSDIVRKELAGLAPTAKRPAPLEQGIYSPEFSRQTYDGLLALAERDLAAGRREVVLDASYQARAERDRVRQLAARLGCRILFILCTCPETEIRRRLAWRAVDPAAVSDGRWEIYLQQRRLFEPPDECRPDECFAMDTAAPLPDLVRQLAEKVARSGGVN